MTVHHDVVLLAASGGAESGQVEAVVAAVGLGIAAVFLVLSLVLVGFRRGRPLRWFGSSVVALLGTVVLLSFV